MKKNVPLSEPVVKGNEWKYVNECLSTGWISSVGAYVSKFEDSVVKYIGSRYAIATINGTAALHVSLISCGVSSNDEVITPTLTFVAPVNTVRYCGAQPIFMDCDPDTLCIDTEKTIEFIKKNTLIKTDGFCYNKTTGRRIKAIIPVHVFGHPVDMDNLIDVCKRYNIAIIEDATESFGSLYKGRNTGTFGRVGCFSFNGNKIVTTGGGGMITTNSAKIAGRIRHLTTQAKRKSIEYDHDDIGYNYRLTNVLAAIGVAQMEKIGEYIESKRKNALLYKKLLSGIEKVKFLWEKPWARSNFWFYTIKSPKRHKTALLRYLISNGIQARPIWKLIHKLPMYRDCQIFDIKEALSAYDTCINIPCSTDLKEEYLKYVVRVIERYFKAR